MFKTIILFLSLDISKRSLSSFVNSSPLFKINSTKSAFSKTSFDFSTPIFSTMSSVSLIPAVSMRFRVIPFRLNDASTMSLVVPGIFVTIALFSSISLFKILLFPTFGLPIIATFIPFFISLLFSEFFIILFKSFSMSTISFFILSMVTSSISSYSG